MLESAPLTETPDLKAPGKGGGYWFKGADGAQLRAALFKPKGLPRGTVVLGTGRTEPIEKYFEVIGDLLGRGFVVLAHEWRGQGLSHRELSDRLKGHAKGVQPYMEDFQALLVAFEAQMPKPWIAMGHSMGGCLTLTALAKGQAHRFAGAILCAPMLGLRAPPLASVLVGLQMLTGHSGDYARPPVDPLKDKFEGNVVTSDPVRFARAGALLEANPDLALGSPTWGWLDFAIKATRWLADARNLVSVTLPVVIVSAERDQLVTDPAQRAIAAALPKGRFVSVAGAEHEILMETDDKRAGFWAEFDLLAAQLAPK